jgi:hypothetical protein
VLHLRGQVVLLTLSVLVARHLCLSRRLDFRLGQLGRRQIGHLVGVLLDVGRRPRRFRRRRVFLRRAGTALGGAGLRRPRLLQPGSVPHRLDVGARLQAGAAVAALAPRRRHSAGAAGPFAVGWRRRSVVRLEQLQLVQHRVGVLLLGARLVGAGDLGGRGAARDHGQRGARGPAGAGDRTDLIRGTSSSRQGRPGQRNAAAALVRDRRRSAKANNGCRLLGTALR